MIDINKKYRTEDGWEVRLYTTNGMNPEFPIVGEVNNDGDIEIVRWDCNGRNSWHGQLTEVPIWEPSPELVAVLRPGWIACDPSSHQWWWYTKKPTRIARGDWSCDSSGSGGEAFRLELIRKTLLPPINEQTMNQAFKIGNPE